MNTDRQAIVAECARGAESGQLAFPEIVTRLSAAGVERYHADYTRHEITYYWPSGNSEVVPLAHPAGELGDEFSPADVEKAVRQSQRGEHTYLDFVRKTMAAGCVGYFVQITGRRVQYFGRRGECHTELFPST